MRHPLWLGLALAFTLSACASSPRSSTQDPWTQWHQMQLPVQIASSRVSKTQAKHFDRFRDHVQAGRYHQALTALAPSAKDPQAAPWAEILKAQLAGLHTRACVDGQWLHLSEQDAEAKNSKPASLSMIKLLDSLSKLENQQDQVLANQAKTATARILVIARDCPGSRMVQRRAEKRLPLVLASLAQAQGKSLAPDLAYLWSTILLEQARFEPAQHWVQVARAQGLRDPRTTLALAQSHLGQGQPKQAEKLALTAVSNLPKALVQLRARAQTLAAQAAWAQGNTKRANDLLDKALRMSADEPSALALAVQIDAATPDECEARLPRRLAALWRLPWSDPPTLVWKADDLMRTLDSQAPSALGCLQAGIAWNIDDESDPALRAIRYYYAATIDARLGDSQRALGRALLARAEFESAGSPRHSLPIQALIDALSGD